MRKWGNHAFGFGLNALLLDWDYFQFSLCSRRARHRAAPAPAAGLRATQKGAPVYGAAILIGLIAFSPALAQTGLRGPLAFLAIVPLLWAALLHGPRVTASAALIVYGFAIWGVAAGGGPFSRPDLNESFLLLLTFGISTAVPSLVLSADAVARRPRKRCCAQTPALRSLAGAALRGPARPSAKQRPRPRPALSI